MSVMRLAVVGFGKLGRACVKAINEDAQCAVAGIVRRPEHVAQQLPPGYEDIQIVSHITELGPVDAALICVPTEQAPGIARELLQERVPIVECAALHGEAFERHKDTLDSIAKRHKVSAVVGAGWDPGVLSVIRNLLALMITKGYTEITHHPGINLHHTTLAKAIPGVKAALSTEIRAANDRRQRYVYVELEEYADLEEVERAIQTDPLFINEETLVFAVDSVATLEDEGHGILLERRGSAGPVEHQLLLLEGRYSERALAARVMVAAARALSKSGHRAYSLFDLPLRSLWGELCHDAEQRWI